MKSVLLRTAGSVPRKVTGTLPAVLSRTLLTWGTTLQGAESQISAALRNHIRRVEPQKMLERVVELQWRGFWQRQRAALVHAQPVEPTVEKFMATLSRKAGRYQSTVIFVKGTSLMEASVRSFTDRNELRRFGLTTCPQTTTAVLFPFQELFGLPVPPCSRCS